MLDVITFFIDNRIRRIMRNVIDLPILRTVKAAQVGVGSKRFAEAQFESGVALVEAGC